MGQGIHAFMKTLIFFRQVQGYDYKERWHHKNILGGIQEAMEKKDTYNSNFMLRFATQ
jgi:hypothetical protein